MSIIDKLNKMEEGKPIYPSELYENFVTIASYVKTQTDALNQLYEDRMALLAGQFSPIGSIIAFPSSTIPEGYLLCDGSEKDIDESNDYYDLYKVITTTYNLSTTASTKFRIPDYQGVFLRGAGQNSKQSAKQASSIGTYQASKAPNITGSYFGSNLMGGEPLDYCSGALYRDTSRTTGYDAEYNDKTAYGLGFNASKSSSVYKDGITEIRPDNHAVNWIIKYKNIKTTTTTTTTT